MFFHSFCIYFPLLCPILDPVSTRTHFTTGFGCYLTVLLALERFYGGQKSNSQNLYYFNTHISFWTYIQSSTNNSENMRKCIPVLKGSQKVSLSYIPSVCFQQGQRTVCMLQCSGKLGGQIIRSSILWYGNTSPTQYAKDSLFSL